MTAAYDSYDYTSYWVGRDYEHKSETLALRTLLKNIPNIGTVVDIGAGFGRLTSEYVYRSKKVILTDPSVKNLNIAKSRINNKKVFYIQSTIQNLNNKIRKNSSDVVIMVRVLHHLENFDKVLDTVYRLLKSKGYFILEYANKKHYKALLKQMLKGNFTFSLDIFPNDIRSKRSIKNKTLPFYNYHPDLIKQKLESCGFKILETLSVSNIRNPRLKKLIPLETLLYFEEYLQKPLAKINFGPSIFLLAQKK